MARRELLRAARKLRRRGVGFMGFMSLLVFSFQFSGKIKDCASWIVEE
jgi:hypothetical protein